MKICLTKGYVAHIDAINRSLVAKYKWHAIVKKNGAVYAHTSLTKAGIRSGLYMHRMLLPNASEVDHWDGNGLNNRMSNLRASSPSSNRRAFQRKPKGKSSRFRGVSWDQRAGKWEAYVYVGAKKHSVGMFKSEHLAGLKRDEEALSLFGRVAHVNFPSGAR